MANLAHRAGRLLEKNYLIIHPTADGDEIFFSSALQSIKYCDWHLIYLSPLSVTLSFLTITTEKVHFQHTAKFINHLISDKANYTLQVSHDGISVFTMARAGRLYVTKMRG